MADSDGTESESAFWRFSLRFYARPGVPELCLTLQDEYGVDVNLLLFLLYSARQGLRLSVDDLRDIDHTIKDWRTQVVQPLRTIRRQLKSGIPPIATAASEALRSKIKNCELHAERLQQNMMELRFAAPTPIAAPGVIRDAAAANIRAYGRLLETTGSTLPNKPAQELLEEFSCLYGAP